LNFFTEKQKASKAKLGMQVVGASASPSPTSLVSYLQRELLYAPSFHIVKLKEQLANAAQLAATRTLQINNSSQQQQQQNQQQQQADASSRAKTRQQQAQALERRIKKLQVLVSAYEAVCLELLNTIVLEYPVAATAGTSVEESQQQPHHKVVIEALQAIAKKPNREQIMARMLQVPSASNNISSYSAMSSVPFKIEKIYNNNNYNNASSNNNNYKLALVVEDSVARNIEHYQLCTAIYLQLQQELKRSILAATRSDGSSGGSEEPSSGNKQTIFMKQLKYTLLQQAMQRVKQTTQQQKQPSSSTAANKTRNSDNANSSSEGKGELEGEDYEQQQVGILLKQYPRASHFALMIHTNSSNKGSSTKVLPIAAKVNDDNDVDGEENEDNEASVTNSFERYIEKIHKKFTTSEQYFSELKQCGTMISEIQRLQLKIKQQTTQQNQQEKQLTLQNVARVKMNNNQQQFNSNSNSNSKRYVKFATAMMEQLLLKAAAASSSSTRESSNNLFNKQLRNNSNSKTRSKLLLTIINSLLAAVPQQT